MKATELVIFLTMLHWAIFAQSFSAGMVSLAGVLLWGAPLAAMTFGFLVMVRRHGWD